jgi:hypothetical protein
VTKHLRSNSYKAKFIIVSLLPVPPRLQLRLPLISPAASQ